VFGFGDEDIALDSEGFNRVVCCRNAEISLSAADAGKETNMKKQSYKKQQGFVLGNYRLNEVIL